MDDATTLAAESDEENDSEPNSDEENDSHTKQRLRGQKRLKHKNTMTIVLPVLSSIKYTYMKEICKKYSLSKALVFRELRIARCTYFLFQKLILAFAVFEWRVYRTVFHLLSHGIKNKQYLC